MRTPPHSRDSGDCAAEGRGGTAAERRTGQRHGGGCLKGGGRSGENGQNLKMKKKPVGVSPPWSGKE